MKYSPVPGSGNHHRSRLRAFLKSPLIFYLILIGLSFGAGYLTRTFSEYWQLYSRLRNAGGHDLTVKHVQVKHHAISSPTDVENSRIITHHQVTNGNPSHQPAPVAAALEKPANKQPVAHPQNNKPKVSCNECSLGLCDEPDPSLFTEVSTEIQLFLNMRFPCNGVITAWKLIDYNPTPGKVVYLDIIRYINASDQGTWMAFNTITTTGEAGWVTYEIPKSEQVTVERDWLVAMHYDDLNADGVVPHAQDPASGLHLYDGFGILMDHQELRRIAPLREASRVPITAALKQLLVELHQPWRAPALAAIVTPT